MIPDTAYILGNGPTLPVEFLPALSKSFTIGVNRIMLSGFTPTVLLTADPEVNAEYAQQAVDAGVLVVSSFSDGPWPVVPLRPVGGDVAWQHEPRSPKFLHVDGSTGVAAARWARALGCSCVYLLGMSASYVGGLTDFYGVNGAHGQSTLAQLRGDREKLLASWHGYVPADDLCLDAIADGDDVDQAALRAHLREVLA